MPEKLRPSLGFISIEIRNLERSRKFYERLAGALDLGPVYEGEGFAGWGNSEFHLVISEEERTRVVRKKPTAGSPRGSRSASGYGSPTESPSRPP